MEKVQLDKELRTLKNDDTRQMDGNLNEVKLLMAGDGAQDLHILRNLAGQSRIARAEDQLGLVIDLEKNTLAFGETFTIDQIEVLARKYQLRFLGSRLFLGDLPVDTIAKVKEFAKNHQVPCLDEFSLKTQFFILAPVQSFNLEGSTTSVRAIHQQEKEAARAERLKRLAEMDPVLFYKIDNKHYRMIHKWGKDFTP